MDNLTPQIEFRVAGFTPNDNAHKFVLQIIQPAMVQMELTNGDVRKIVIADNDHYGAAIKEFAPNEGYTNDGIYQGVGKILPQIENSCYAGSNLVLHVCVIGGFAAVDDDRPAGEGDAMRYGIYHELGHCADYRRRQVQHVSKAREGNTSLVLRCAEGNSATLLSEYAACFFSASFLTPEGFAFVADSTAANLTRYLKELTEKRDRYRLRLLDLRIVRDAAMETFWRSMIEFSKLFAYLRGNPALAVDGKAALVWPGASQVGSEEIQLMAVALHEAWNSYPNCAEAFEQTLTGTWFAISKAEGYRFEVQSDGDYLWLD